MWLEIFNYGKVFMSVIFCAAAVKIADDFLDAEIDKRAGRSNWAEAIGRGAMIYSMLFLGLAACLDLSISLSLFFGSYSVGMLQDLNHRFPTALSGWQECLVVFTFGAILLGLKIMVFSLFFLLAVQLFDDCIDAQEDKNAGLRNLAHRLGLVEAYLLAILTLLLSWWAGRDVFVPVLCATAFFYGCLRYQEVQKNA